MNLDLNFVHSYPSSCSYDWSLEEALYRLCLWEAAGTGENSQIARQQVKSEESPVLKFTP